ncbi:MAG: substrate-binding periplasmic protein [Alphaproteobacteria bacterium]
MRALIACILATTFFAAPLSAGRAKHLRPVVKLYSLNWKPYTGKNLYENGLSAYVVRKAFEAVGYELIIEFYPWKRTLANARENISFHGYFPAYFNKEREKEFIFSEAFGNSPLGFVENVAQPISWNSLDDLQEHLIGTVTEYANTPEFDEKVTNDVLNTDEASGDKQNILKVAHGRLPLAVIDKHVLSYLVENDLRKRDIGHLVQFNDKTLADKSLYICFKKSPEGEKMNKIFSEGLKKIDIQALEKEYRQKVAKG